MKYWLIIPLFLNGLTSFSVYAQPSQESIVKSEKILLQLEINSLTAEFSLDTTQLSSIIDAGFVDISEQGVHNKTESLLTMYHNISTISETILLLAAKRGKDKTICPSEVARKLSADNWRRYMKTIRQNSF